MSGFPCLGEMVTLERLTAAQHVFFHRRERICVQHAAIQLVNFHLARWIAAIAAVGAKG